MSKMPKSELTSDLDKTLRLLALIALDGKKQKEQIQLLDKAGFGQSDIAEMLGSTPKAISVRLAELRRAKRNAGKE
jgi:DNA-directed RNA polymerase specialized sigma24 family protein